MKIEDGTGKGYHARIDKLNRFHTFAQTESESLAEARAGRAYNLHGGSITLSTTGTLIYLKNNETQDLIIEGMVIALGEGTVSDSPEVMLYQDVTGGNLVTDELPVAYTTNRNYGSSRVLDVDAYGGKTGGTIVGDDTGIFYFRPASRNFAELNTILPKGATIGVYIDPKLSGGTMKAYAVLVTYLADEASA